MKKEDLKGKKITVMGLGLHGGAAGAVRFLAGLGAKLLVTDIKSKEELAPTLEKLKDLKNVSYVLGQHRPEDFSAADMVLKNPAVRWSNKYVKIAIEKKIPVEMDSSLFFKLCPNLIIGITGTKGKTTTSYLIHKILKKAGREAILVGAGQNSVLDKIKDLKKESIVVFELSSWRLSGLGKFKLSPSIAVITNIYPDHLDFYKTIEDYIGDKKYIFSGQKKEDVAIINSDNNLVASLESEIKSKIVKFSKNKISGGESVYADQGLIYFNNGIDEKKILEIEEIALRGGHNLENALAAIAVARNLKIETAIISEAIKEFQGVPHRLELIGEFKGIKYVNDTAATTPEAAIAALDSFLEPIILICGGSDKNLEMKNFAAKILEKAKAVVFLKGAGTEKIISAMKNQSEEMKEREFKIVDSIEKALELAQSEALPGEMILLSPGAASFGMFKNEFDRGDKFREAVKNLK